MTAKAEHLHTIARQKRDMTITNGVFRNHTVNGKTESFYFLHLASIQMLANLNENSVSMLMASVHGVVAQ